MSKSAFPDPADALSDPPGLIAVGGDLTIERLTDAYRHGIFPWFEAGQPILWWTLSHPSGHRNVNIHSVSEFASMASPCTVSSGAKHRL